MSYEPAMFCVLCSFRDNAIATAGLVVDGYSLCGGHARDVVERADGIFFDNYNRFHLQATIQAAHK
jgi:hypothetical protein